MLWYGVTFLYVLMTMFSFMIDGQSGFYSSELRATLGSDGTVIDVTETIDLPFDSNMVMTIGNEKMIVVAPSEGCAAPKTCFHTVQRGIDETTATQHPAGSRIYSERAGALNDIVAFRVAEADTVWGKIKFPFQAANAYTGLVAKVVSWDYSYLDGNGIYFKLIFFYPLSALMVFALARMFTDALSILGLRK